VAVFPQSSVAVQVRVVVYVPVHAPGVVLLANVIVTVASQASVAVATPKKGVAEHSIGLITEGQEMTGETLSAITIS